MRVGTVKEIKRHEYRVGLTPACVNVYVQHGHDVFVETGAGFGAGFEDEDYQNAGAKICSSRDEIFSRCDMIVKVKEPLSEEYPLFHDGQILFTYLHLAASRELTEAMLNQRVNAVAYETIATARGTLPCLKPMSEIAGRLSVQEGAKYLEKPFGGRGVLLAGVPGVARGRVAILGGGVVGTNACKIALGMGAKVTVLDINADRLTDLDDMFNGHITTLQCSPANIEQVLRESDLIIGAVLIPGARAPKLVRRHQLKLMKKHAVIVDVAVDQGGCIETSKPTTHDHPVFMVDGIVHYCVANMPGAVSLTSTQALTNATLPYGLMLADHGLEDACRQSTALALGLNTYKGHCTCARVAEAFGLEYVPPDTFLANGISKFKETNIE
jgi:alanine dehydrogenase